MDRRRKDTARKLEDIAYGLVLVMLLVFAMVPLGFALMLTIRGGW